jgi:hypothetical protein
MPGTVRKNVSDCLPLPFQGGQEKNHAGEKFFYRFADGMKNDGTPRGSANGGAVRVVDNL